MPVRMPRKIKILAKVMGIRSIVGRWAWRISCRGRLIKSSHCPCTSWPSREALTALVAMAVTKCRILNQSPRGTCERKAKEAPPKSTSLTIHRSNHLRALSRAPLKIIITTARFKIHPGWSTIRSWVTVAMGSLLNNKMARPRCGVREKIDWIQRRHQRQISGTAAQILD